MIIYSRHCDVESSDEYYGADYSFWDETKAALCGPYNTYEEASEAYKKHTEHLANLKKNKETKTTMILYFENDENPKPDGYNGAGFYFWDETESCCYGPYKTYKEAEDALNKYAEHLTQQ